MSDRNCALADCTRPVGGGTDVVIKVGPLHKRILLCEDHWRALGTISNADDSMTVLHPRD